jgi:hypothetical protein
MYSPRPPLNGQFRSIGDLRRFVEGGKAIVTLMSKKSGERFTYKFNRLSEKESSRPVWVRVLTGPDNSNSQHYKFTGTIFDGYYKHSQNSAIRIDAPSMVALVWFLKKLYQNQATLFQQAEVWHEGICGRCGRRLTVPSSIATGFGPDCAQQLHLDMSLSL